MMMCILTRQAACAAIVVTVFLSGCATPSSDQTRRAEVPVPTPSVNDTTPPIVLPEFTTAIQNGDVTKVVQLLDGNPEQINLAVGEDGSTPLQRSVQYGHQQLTKVLVEQGASVDLADNYGWAPLHYAAMNGKEDAVSFLLEKGADVDRKAHQGETPLHWAVNNNQEKTAVLLVRHGARLNALDDLGRTPLDIAVKMGHASLQRTLREAGCVTSQELAETYDWTASQKTLRKLQTFQRRLKETSAREKQDSDPVKADAHDGE